MYADYSHSINLSTHLTEAAYYFHINVFVFIRNIVLLHL